MLILLLTLLAYLPAMQASFIWDDPQYILDNPTLRDAQGLVAMWTNTRSLPQWYPMVHTTFWIEYQMWGLRPAGYHIVNILIHAINALLLWKLLTRLEVPGAWLAAAVFALHPVHVESVAWVTERKNTLSLMFYLLSAICFLRSIRSGDERIDLRWWIVSLLLFAAALLSKTVTASLPAALLLVMWWKQGWRVPRRWIAALVPYFALGLLLALQTASLERELVGASGHEWDYAPTLAGEAVHRTLIAGRACWFYAAKLIAPVNLTFIYPRWQIDRSAAWQYLFPITAAALVMALWMLRRRIGRGPLAAVLIFGGTLLPALGYFNVFPHRYSFVADHFQFHASIAMIALLVAAGASGARRWANAAPLRITAAAVLLVALGALTFAHARNYHDPITLWRDTVAKNPQGWMPWTNLGNALVAAGRTDEAIESYEVALKLAPDVYDVQWNAGVARARAGDLAAAEAHFREAVRIMPSFVPGYVSLAQLELEDRRNPAAAVQWLERALEVAPNNAEAHLHIARALRQQGHVQQSAAHYRQAIASREDHLEAHLELGILLSERQQHDEAIWNLQHAVRIAPDQAQTHASLGIALLAAGRGAEAIAPLRRALEIDPNHRAAQQALRLLGQ